MSKPKTFKGFINADSYELYRNLAETLELNLCHVREEEESKQISYWLKSDYTFIRNSARRMLGYCECLWDFDIISEDVFEGLYDAYAKLAREAEERIDELSEE